MAFLKTNQKQYKNEQKRIDEYMDYKIEKAMRSHKESSVLDHLDGSVTDEKFGERTVIDASTDSGDYTGFFSAIINSIANAIRSVRKNFNTHKSDNYIHITDVERQNWNTELENTRFQLSEVMVGNTPVGFAYKADCDFFDNVIADTYATKKEVNVVSKDVETVKNNLSTVESIAKGANQAISFPNYRTAINALNGIIDPNKYKIGQSVLIETLNVPDLWISDITTVIPDDAHIYTTDEDFVTELKAKGHVWLEMFKLSPLETQKVDLTEYATEKDLKKTNNLIGDVISGVQIVHTAQNADRAYMDWEGRDIHTHYATKAEIDSIKTKKAMFSNGDSIMLDNNKMYYANSEISELTINYPDGDFISSLEFTLASEGDITITLPESKYIGGVPTFANGEAWELNIKNGVVVGGLVK